MFTVRRLGISGRLAATLTTTKQPEQGAATAELQQRPGHPPLEGLPRDCYQRFTPPTRAEPGRHRFGTRLRGPPSLRPQPLYDELQRGGRRRPVHVKTMSPVMASGLSMSRSRAGLEDEIERSGGDVPEASEASRAHHLSELGLTRLAPSPASTSWERETDRQIVVDPE